MGLGLELVPHEVLEGLGLEGGGQLPLADFLLRSRCQPIVAGVGGQGTLDPGAVVTHLDIAQHVLLDGSKGNGAEKIWWVPR